MNLPGGIQNRFSFGIWRYMKHHDKPQTEAEATRLEGLALNKRSSSERTKLLNFIAGTFLKQMHLNLILCRVTNGTELDWENLSSFYRTKLMRTAVIPEVGEGHVRKIHELFNAGMPDYERDAASFVKLMRDPRPVDLRGLIDEAVREDKKLDEQFWLSELRDLFKLREGAAVRIDATRTRNAHSHVALKGRSPPWSNEGEVYRALAQRGLYRSCEFDYPAWPTSII